MGRKARGIDWLMEVRLPIGEDLIPWTPRNRLKPVAASRTPQPEGERYRDSAEWHRMRDAIKLALLPFPAARDAVVAALGRLEADEEDG